MNETASSQPAALAPGRYPARRRVALTGGMRCLAAPFLGALIGLALGGVLMRLAGASPVAAYRVMIEGAVGGQLQITETLLKAGPLLLMGLGLTVAFRSKMWNLGGEGQYFMGALAGTVVGLAFRPAWPAVILIPAMLVTGAVGGALWAGLAAWLKIRRGISEIISTLMLNYIAVFLVSYLVRGPLKDPASFLPQTAQLVGPARMPTLFGTRIHIGVLLAVLLLPTVYVMLWKTSLGFRLRAIGSSQNVARYAGMNVPRGLAFALLCSGALAGLTGTIEVSALHSRLKDTISGNYGFTGILVALLGRLHPIGVLLAALFFAALANGAQTMHSLYGLPVALAQIIQGLIVLSVLAADGLARRRWR
jgi:general nucleoside transport system permease protein